MSDQIRLVSVYLNMLTLNSVLMLSNFRMTGGLSQVDSHRLVGISDKMVGHPSEWGARWRSG